MLHRSAVAAIPEEEIWLSKPNIARERAHTPRLSARCRTLYVHSRHHDTRGIAPGRPQTVIAWERYMCEVEGAASSTIRRRLAALSSLYKHLMRHGRAPETRLVRSSGRRSTGMKARRIVPVIRAETLPARARSVPLSQRKSAIFY
jgi:hypothetical protein